MLAFKIIICAILIAILLMTFILLLDVCIMFADDLLSDIFGYKLTDIIKKRWEEKHDYDFI